MCHWSQQGAWQTSPNSQMHLPMSQNFAPQRHLDLHSMIYRRCRSWLYWSLLISTIASSSEQAPGTIVLDAWPRAQLAKMWWRSVRIGTRKLVGRPKCIVFFQIANLILRTIILSRTEILIACIGSYCIKQHTSKCGCHTGHTYSDYTTGVGCGTKIAHCSINNTDKVLGNLGARHGIKSLQSTYCGSNRKGESKATLDKSLLFHTFWKMCEQMARVNLLNDNSNSIHRTTWAQ